MRKIVTGIKIATFDYDVAIDGGAVDVQIRTGFIMPVGVRLTQIHFANIVNFASAGGLATIEVRIGTQVIGFTAGIDIARLNGSRNVNPEMTFTAAVGELIIIPRTETFTAGRGVFYIPYFEARI